MKVFGWVTVLGLALILGLTLSLTLNNTSGMTRLLDYKNASADAIQTTPSDNMIEKTPKSPVLLTTQTRLETPPENVAQPKMNIPGIELGEGRQNDLQDVLLLYDSTNLITFPVNFCKIAEYYGLLCKKVDLTSSQLTDQLLRDAQGSYFQLIGIDAPALLQQPSLLGKEQITLLKNAVEMSGVNLLIEGFNGKGGIDLTFLTELTDGAILGMLKFKQAHHNWVVSGAIPNLTREFTGQVITSSSTTQQSSSALLVNNSSIVPVISALEDMGWSLPVFVRWKKGTGAVYVNAGQSAASLDRTRLKDLYYDPANFLEIVPLMMTIQATMGDEAWHNDHHYANLTIDGPSLVEPFQNLSYIYLLREMLVHNFHTTIAFIPANWQETQPEVVRLFQYYPDLFSLVQQGNNADGYEFYKYHVPLNNENSEFPDRPFTEQSWDIQEGLARMELLKNNSGLPYERIMVFPVGISPAQTLQLLKKQDYLASVNIQDVPLDSSHPWDWDYGMYPAVLDYKGFPLLTRRFLGSAHSVEPTIQLSLFDLFLNKPALFYTSASDEGLFAAGISGFSTIADRVNLTLGGVEWQSMGTVLKHLYLEKTNDDGSVNIQMYGNSLILTNESAMERNYHITREETQDIPIAKLTVNGQLFPYQCKNNVLTLDLKIPASFSIEILIHFLQ